nr:hypothetical protein [Tanacetum cinerariifolium]
MTSFDYRLNPRYPIKECSSCGALYTMDYYCSVGILENNIIYNLDKTPDLSQRSPQNCPKCGNPVYGHYCQRCALLREKFKEDLNGAHYGYNCPPKVPILPNLEPFNNHTIKDLPPTVQSFDPKSDLVHNSPNVFSPSLQPSIYSYEFCGNKSYYGQDCSLQYLDEMKRLINSEYHDEIKIYELKENFNGMSIKNNKKEKLQQLEQWANLSTYPSKRFNSFCYDDDDKDYTIAFTPSLSIKEPDNSLSMGDEHLDTIPETKSDEFIKSGVENLISIPSESEGIPDNMCGVPFHDNSLPLDISKDQFEDFFDSNDEFSSTDDNSFSIDNIDYVVASPLDSELVNSEVMDIVIPEVGGIDDDFLLTIKDDILSEKLLNINLFIAKIEALNNNPTPSSDFMTKSSSTSLNSLLEETNTFDNSLPEFKTFCFDVEEISSDSTTTRFDISLLEDKAFYDDHVKEISSGSNTTHSDTSLYDSFIFDLSINPFPPADRSDFYEFADELIHIISPPEYDCFFFKIEPNSGDFTMDVVEDISPTRKPRVHNALPTHPTLQLNLEFQSSSESIFTYGVWIFLHFLLYSVAL